MKKTYIECLRIIAIILVIYNHTRELGFTLYQYTSDACSYYLSVLMIPVCKTAVSTITPNCSSRSLPSPIKTGFIYSLQEDI